VFPAQGVAQDMLIAVHNENSNKLMLARELATTRRELSQICGFLHSKDVRRSQFSFSTEAQPKTSAYRVCRWQMLRFVGNVRLLNANARIQISLRESNMYCSFR